MWRRLHSLPGLFAALFLITLAITGAIMSVEPALERMDAVVPGPGEVSVAQLAERVVAHYPGAEQIRRLASGAVIVYFTRDGSPGADLVNPATGEQIAAYEPSVFFRWVKDLHRSFLLDDPGRMLAGVMAVVMVLICLSGAFLLIRRIGGWRFLFKPMSGAGHQRIHAELARFAVMGLLLSALTGAYMSGVRFGILPDSEAAEPSFPAEVSGGPPAPVGDLKALKNTDLSKLRELVFPYPDDREDVFSLTTTEGAGFVDQSTGQYLKYEVQPSQSWLYGWIVRLHTAEGLWWLGLMLGLAAATVPVLSFTGIWTWCQRRRSHGRVPEDSGAECADTVILVGSEGGTTRGFARELHRKLNDGGCRVHCADMNQLAERYPKAATLFILTATYGDGGAPASASEFMAKLAAFSGQEALKYCVLGFGDRQFPNFCRFAREVDGALGDKGLVRGYPATLIDRQSSVQFAEWGLGISQLLEVPLTLNHHSAPACNVSLELLERVDFGVEVQAPTSIFRFKTVPGRRLWSRFTRLGAQGVPRFDAGDLIGIKPPGDHSPRLYSLASSSEDGLLEICVRKQPGGLCSGYLHGLKSGDRISGFIQHNPEFRPAAGNNPVILIGAGTGIGPLAGFIRKNANCHPMYLYWGGRNPRSDFLYQLELGRYLEDRRLTDLRTAFSRSTESAYVQDRIAEDATSVRQLVERGGQILVCGGRDMAAGVKQTINGILQPLRIDTEWLKAKGRYLEDVY